MEIILLIIIIVLLGLIIVSYSFKSLDFVAICLICCFLASTITGLMKHLDITTFVAFINFEAIILVLCMSIITKILEESNVLEFVAIKLFKLSGGNQRAFFYLLCITAAILGAIITDDFLIICILAPIVIRLCYYLKTRAGTYLLGLTISTSFGGLFTPFSGGENIIISTYFHLTTLYFVQYYWLFGFILIFSTIILMDRLLLTKEPKIEKQQSRIVLDMIDTDVIVKNKKMFYFNSVAFIITIILLVILPLLYLTAAFAALILVLVNRKFTGKKMSDTLKDIDWELIFFFISLYIVVGCMLEAGFEEIFMALPLKDLNVFVVGVIILIIVSVCAGVMINTPIALILVPIIDLLISEGFSPTILLFALIIGLTVGDNLIPQGSARNLMTYKLAKKAGVPNLSYKRMLKAGIIITIFHVSLAIVWMFLMWIFQIE